LIAQSIAARENNRSKASAGSSVIGILASVVLGTVLLVLALAAGVFKSPLPVVAAHRGSYVSNSKVLHLENQTGNPISVTVTVERNGKVAMFPTVVRVPPDGTAEFGWAEGWAFEKGDRAILSHPQYRGYALRFE